MEENIFSHENEDSLNPEYNEQLRMENELLKLKIQAQYGGISGGEGTGGLNAEIENEFLKQVIAFEEQYTKEDHSPVKVSAVLSAQGFKKSEDLNDAEFVNEWNRLLQLLEEKKIGVDFIRARDDRFKYKFITEELFDHESDGGMMRMGWNFIYEEFHPDHEQEITDRSMQFLMAWFERNSESLNYGIVGSFMQPDGVILKQEEIIHKIQLVFDAYRSFKDCKYHFFEVKFELQEGIDGKIQGIGHSEGMVKYDAILENGERKTIEGPFKLYMTRDYDWWSIFYFVMEGFDGAE